jgi:hypothetical protein
MLFNLKEVILAQYPWSTFSGAHGKKKVLEMYSFTSIYVIPLNEI